MRGGEGEAAATTFLHPLQVLSPPKMHAQKEGEREAGGQTSRKRQTISQRGRGQVYKKDVSRPLHFTPWRPERKKSFISPGERSDGKRWKWDREILISLRSSRV